MKLSYTSRQLICTFCTIMGSVMVLSSKPLQENPVAPVIIESTTHQQLIDKFLTSMKFDEIISRRIKIKENIKKIIKNIGLLKTQEEAFVSKLLSPESIALFKQTIIEELANAKLDSTCIRNGIKFFEKHEQDELINISDVMGTLKDVALSATFSATLKSFLFIKNETIDKKEQEQSIDQIKKIYNLLNKLITLKFSKSPWLKIIVNKEKIIQALTPVIIKNLSKDVIDSFSIFIESTSGKKLINVYLDLEEDFIDYFNEWCEKAAQDITQNS